MNQDLPAMMLQFVYHMKLALGVRTSLDLALKVCSTNRMQEHWQPPDVMFVTCRLIQQFIMKGLFIGAIN